MFSRVVTFTGVKDLDGGVVFVRDQVAPLMRQQHGFRGLDRQRRPVRRGLGRACPCGTARQIEMPARVRWPRPVRKPRPSLAAR